MKYGDKIYYYLKNHKLNYYLLTIIIFSIKLKRIRIKVIIFSQVLRLNSNIIHQRLLFTSIRNLLIQGILQIIYKIS